MLTRRGPLAILLGIAVALVAASWAQPFVTVQLEPSEATAPVLVLTGTQSVPTVGLLALVLAVAFIISLASRRVVRSVTLIIGVLASLGQVGLIVTEMSAPAALARPFIADVTGVFDLISQQALIVDIAFQPWLIVALCGSVVCVAVSILALIASRAWPTPGRRYERQGETPRPREATPSGDSSEAWDALTMGEDPTTPSG